MITDGWISTVNIGKYKDNFFINTEALCDHHRNIVCHYAFQSEDDKWYLVKKYECNCGINLLDPRREMSLTDEPNHWTKVEKYLG